MARSVVFQPDAVLNIGTIKSLDKQLSLIQFQFADDLPTGWFICCSGECDARHSWKAIMEEIENPEFADDLLETLFRR